MATREKENISSQVRHKMCNTGCMGNPHLVASEGPWEGSATAPSGVSDGSKGSSAVGSVLHPSGAWAMGRGDPARAKTLWCVLFSNGRHSLASPCPRGPSVGPNRNFMRGSQTILKSICDANAGGINGFFVGCRNRSDATNRGFFYIWVR